MKNTKNVGIIVAVLGLLLTCCLCPLAVNGVMTIATKKGFYTQLFTTSTATVFNGQIICAGILALIVLVIGIVVLIQARGNGAKPEQGGV